MFCSGRYRMGRVLRLQLAVDDARPGHYEKGKGENNKKGVGWLADWLTLDRLIQQQTRRSRSRNQPSQPPTSSFTWSPPSLSRTILAHVG